MTTKAYLMIDVAEKFCRNGYLDVLRDLADIREVQSVERIDGICDIMVKAEGTDTKGFVADQIMPKEWVKSLRVFNVEPGEPMETAPVVVPEFEHAETLLTQ